MPHTRKPLAKKKPKRRVQAMMAGPTNPDNPRMRAMAAASLVVTPRIRKTPPQKRTKKRVQAMMAGPANPANPRVRAEMRSMQTAEAVQSDSDSDEQIRKYERALVQARKLKALARQTPLYGIATSDMFGVNSAVQKQRQLKLLERLKQKAKEKAGYKAKPKAKARKRR